MYFILTRFYLLSLNLFTCFKFIETTRNYQQVSNVDKYQTTKEFTTKSFHVSSRFLN